MAVGVVAAYLIGTFPTAQLVVARPAGRQTTPPREGSGNPGASNVYRIAGKRAGVAVGVIDALKGAVPVGDRAGRWPGRPEAHAVWVAAVAGHVWPVTRRFRGGKGVATAGGGGLVISPLIGLACGVLFFAVVKLGRDRGAGFAGDRRRLPDRERDRRAARVGGGRGRRSGSHPRSSVTSPTSAGCSTSDEARV